MSGRESVLPLPPGSEFLHYLDQCVEMTESCVRTFSDGLRRLEPGTRDLPRLTKIMRNQHHYLLLPAPVIAAHKNALCESLGPQVDQLISRSGALVDAQTEHMKRLEERLAVLQSARPAGSRSQASAFAPKKASGANDDDDAEEDDADGATDAQARDILDSIDMKDLSMQQRRKVIMLRGKRKKLEEDRASLLAQRA